MSGPVRVYSDAAGAGGLAGLTLMAPDDFPFHLLPRTEAKQGRHSLVATAKTYISEPFVSVVTVPGLGGELRGWKIPLFPDSEPACAARTKGAARNSLALTPFHMLR